MQQTAALHLYIHIAIYAVRTQARLVFAKRDVNRPWRSAHVRLESPISRASISFTLNDCTTRISTHNIRGNWLSWVLYNVELSKLRLITNCLWYLSACENIASYGATPPTALRQTIVLSLFSQSRTAAAGQYCKGIRTIRTVNAVFVLITLRLAQVL